MPSPAAIFSKSKPCGIPNTVSKPATFACGRVEKIPPPSLLIAMMRKLAEVFPTKPVKSCKKAKSPIIAVALGRAVAIPSAVEMLPSIPASPRLAKVSIPVRGVAKLSRSRMGLDDAMKTAPVNSTANSRAKALSDQLDISLTSLAVRRLNLRHCSCQSGSAGLETTLGAAINR